MFYLQVFPDNFKHDTQKQCILTSNFCRLWTDLQIKLKSSQDTSMITISNFCEKQSIPIDENLIIQNPHFDIKYIC